MPIWGFGGWRTTKGWEGGLTGLACFRRTRTLPLGPATGRPPPRRPPAPPPARTAAPHGDGTVVRSERRWKQNRKVVNTQPKGSANTNRKTCTPTWSRASPSSRARAWLPPRALRDLRPPRPETPRTVRFCGLRAVRMPAEVFCGGLVRVLVWGSGEGRVVPSRRRRRLRHVGESLRTCLAPDLHPTTTPRRSGPTKHHSGSPTSAARVRRRSPANTWNRNPR